MSGEFHAAHSDLNVLCVVDRAAAADLERLHPVAEWWLKERNPAPLIFTMEELRRSADVFAIELVDIKRHHRMLLGTDFLDAFRGAHALAPPAGGTRAAHRVGCGCGRPWWQRRKRRKCTWGSCLSRWPRFAHSSATPCSRPGRPCRATKREAVDAVASLSGGNPAGFHAILDLREGKRKEKEIDIELALTTSLEFVEVVTNEVDRRLDAI